MKINIYIIILLLGLLTIACQKEIDDKFDKPAAERIDEAVREYHNILVSAPNGWLMEYYGGGEGEDVTMIGGYNLICSFEKDGAVTILSELALGSTATSLYRMIKSLGPVLTFDTYNELLHIFSDPALGPGPPSGYGGDYEFIIMEATSDKVILRGKKGYNTIILRKLDADVVWEKYLEKIVKTRALVLKQKFPRYKIEKGGNIIGELFISNENNLKIFDSNGKEIVSQNLIYTTDGFKMYKPITIDGTEYEYFKIENIYEIETNEDPEIIPIISSKGSNGQTINIVGYMPEGYIAFDYYLGAYNATYTNLNGVAKTKSNCVLSQIKYNESYKLTVLSGYTGVDMILNYDRFDGRIYFSTNNYIGTIASVYKIQQIMWLGGYSIDMGNTYRYYGESNMEALPSLIFSTNNKESKHIGVLLIAEDADGSLLIVSENAFYTNLVLKKR